MQTFLKALVGQKEGWQRRQLEANVWQDLSMGVMQAIGRQLVWSVHGSWEDLQTTSHQPYC